MMIGFFDTAACELCHTGRAATHEPCTNLQHDKEEASTSNTQDDKTLEVRHSRADTWG